MKKIVYTLFTACLFMFFLSSCEKDHNIQKSTPTPPPLATLKVDLSEFQSDVKSTSEEKGFIDYYGFGCRFLSNFNKVICHALEIPFKAFEIAAKAEAVQTDTNRWEWNDSFKFKGEGIDVKLVSVKENDTINWEVYVSGPEITNNEDFLWIKGYSAADGTSGHWDFYHNPDENEIFMSSDWTANKDEVLSVKYTFQRNIKVDDEIINIANSSYEYGKIEEGEYNYYIKYHSDYKNLFVCDFTIQWNSETHTGQVQCNHQFGDNGWCKWDCEHNNIK